MNEKMTLEELLMANLVASLNVRDYLYLISMLLEFSSPSSSEVAGLTAELRESHAAGRTLLEPLRLGEDDADDE